jgi:hypothetical protein
MASAIRTRTRRQIWLRWALVGVAVFFLVELLIRHIPPDGASITRTEVVTSFDGTVTSVTTHTHAYTGDALDALNKALNTAPLQRPYPLLNGCRNGLGGYATYTVTLTWHELPVQVWSSQGCGAYSESSGGVPNILWTRELPYETQARFLTFP